MSMLYPHQSEAIGRLRASFGSGHHRPMFQAPTGYGKTLVAGEIIERALGKGKRILITEPLLSLVDQTVERLAARGIKSGVIQGDHPLTDYCQPVQVASVQTLLRRKVAVPDLVLVDEAHRQFDGLNRWLTSEAMAHVPAIGLSATPWSRGLGRIFDDLVVGARLRELIAGGYLADYRVFAPSHPDLTSVSTVADDYHKGELSAVMARPTLVADVVKTWKRLGQNRTTLVFAVDRAHAQHLVGEFELGGVATGYIDAYTSASERKAIFAKFHDGAVRVIVSVGTLTMGIDLDVRCVVLARPTKSEMLFVQMIGRGLRTAEAKDHCVVLDHSDTTLQLGFPDAIHYDALDDGLTRRSPSRPSKEALPKECPCCSLVKPARVHECPNCGFAPRRQSKVVSLDGELVELDVEKARREAEVQKRQRWYSMLRRVAEKRGYRGGMGRSAIPGEVQGLAQGHGGNLH